jgi:hypothetical protein
LRGHAGPRATLQQNLSYLLRTPTTSIEDLNSGLYAPERTNRPPLVSSKAGRSQGKTVHGDHFEEQVWSDDPEPVPQQLRARQELDAKGSDQISK